MSRFRRFVEPQSPSIGTDHVSRALGGDVPHAGDYNGGMFARVAPNRIRRTRAT